MKRLLLLLLVMLPVAGYGQNMSVKTNLLYDATTTMNLGVEFRLGNHTTIDLSGSYNPWSFSNDKQWKLWQVQPEFRYWFCESFDGHFLGLHAQGGQLNINNMQVPFGLWPDMTTNNYQGEYYGAGISWGYHWILSDRWGLEFTLGVGYTRVEYERNQCLECGHIADGFRNYWGPTKAGISLVFNIF